MKLASIAEVQPILCKDTHFFGLRYFIADFFEQEAAYHNLFKKSFEADFLVLSSFKVPKL